VESLISSLSTPFIFQPIRDCLFAASTGEQLVLSLFLLILSLTLPCRLIDPAARPASTPRP
jgi:hypothetical protein